MELLTTRYSANLAGVLSCYDRIVITGTLPGACYADGMTSFLFSRGIRIFDYTKEFALPLRERIRENAVSLAAEHGMIRTYLDALVDPRTIAPLDTTTIVEAIVDCGRLIVVDEASPVCGMASEIAALAATESPHALKAPTAPPGRCGSRRPSARSCWPAAASRARARGTPTPSSATASGRRRCPTGACPRRSSPGSAARGR